MAFARAHKRALRIEFVVVALLALAAPGGEQWGWPMFFCSLPWSLAATAVPGVLALVIVALGLGLNAVLATIVVGSAFSWWLKTLRYNNDG